MIDPVEYGRTLGGLTLNFIVRDVAHSVPFYTEALGFVVVHQTTDYAALEREGAKIQLHADHTYHRMPWAADLAGGVRRGFGAEIRLLGLDPDAVERAAREHGSVLLATGERPGHGWRDCVVADPDGYTFAVGLPL